jgi:uncharacterized protein (TIRG00374 family)
MNVSRWRIAALTAVIAGISLAVLYFTFDASTLTALTRFHPVSLLGVLLVIAVGMYFDAARLVRLCAVAGYQVSMTAATRVVFGNYFLALLTPGASGGAMIQVLFLKRAGIPTGTATVVVLARTILSIFFLLICLPVVFYFDPQILPWFDRQGIVRIALFLLGLAIVGMLLLRSRISDRLAVVTLKRLPIRWRFRLMKVYRDMRGALGLIAASPLQVLRAFLESALSLLALYAMVPLLLAGMGASLDWLQVMGRMIFINLLLYFAPTPGGAGVAEGLFINSYRSMASLGTVGVAALGWRLFAEYLPACVGGYYTLKVFGRSFLGKEKPRLEGDT